MKQNNNFLNIGVFAIFLLVECGVEAVWTDVPGGY